MNTVTARRKKLLAQKEMINKFLSGISRSILFKERRKYLVVLMGAQMKTMTITCLSSQMYWLSKMVRGISMKATSTGQDNNLDVHLIIFASYQLIYVTLKFQI